MHILFEDYIRYRKEKIRERLKSAVTEQFMALPTGRRPSRPLPRKRRAWRRP